MQPAEFTTKFQTLTPKPRSVLILLLEGKQDDEIAQEIGASEATVRKHIQNLCDHFEISAEVAGIRKNRRQELMNTANQYAPNLLKERKVSPASEPNPARTSPPTLRREIPQSPQDWDGAPDVSVFYGREEELNKLKQWILDESCRLIILLGMSGMGKTTLSVKLAHDLQDEFDYVVWRSLRNAPPLDHLLGDLIGFLSRQGDVKLSKDGDQNISLLLDQLQKSRCLLILDNFDSILSRGDFAGHYQDAYKDYSQLLRRIGQQSHQSCVLLTSLEKPREIALLEGETLPVRTLLVEGLGKAAKEILKAKGLTAETRWGILVKLYRGNPLALKMVASTIQELFAGNVADFLDLSLTGIVQDIIFLVEQQFERLSPLEKTIMYWLAIEQEPIALPQLRRQVTVSELELLTALKSLGERSLIEKSSGKFSLQPVVMEYVKTQFVQRVYLEMEQFRNTQNINQLNLLRNHELKRDQEPLESSEGKIRSILTLLKEQSQRDTRGSTQGMEQIETMLQQLAEISPQEVGYAKTNLQNLLTVLQLPDD